MSRKIEPHPECCPHGCCAFRKKLRALIAKKEKAARRRRRKSIDEFLDHGGL